MVEVGKVEGLNIFEITVIGYFEVCPDCENEATISDEIIYSELHGKDYSKDINFGDFVVKKRCVDITDCNSECITYASRVKLFVAFESVTTLAEVERIINIEGTFNPYIWDDEFDSGSLECGSDLIIESIRSIENVKTIKNRFIPCFDGEKINKYREMVKDDPKRYKIYLNHI